MDLNLAVIGNCVLAALIDARGRIVWTCFPRLDGDPVFCALVDGEPEAGFLDVELEGFRSAEQTYLGNTAILETRLFDGDGGGVRIVDFVPRFKRFGRIFRPINIVRRIEPIAGAPRIRVRVRPRFAHGAARPAVVPGSNHVRYLGPAGTIRVTTDAPVSYLAQESTFLLQGPIHLLLGPDETVPEALGSLARDWLAETEDYWTEWVRYLAIPFEWQEEVIRAAIALKLCSFEETGAIVAALTTSIPESSASGRNWDYRYCWLRDAYFVVHALNRLGATRTMEDYIRYIDNVVALAPDGGLRPAYSIVPEQRLDERVESALAGYRGMGPVRIGNEAGSQVQNDVYGSVVLAAAQMFFDRRLPRRGDGALFARLERLGARAAAAAIEPDAGPWEYRGRARVHTYSAVMCWAALNRLSRIAVSLGLFERAASWRNAAERLHAAILERAWHPGRNSFVESLGGSDVDATLLLLPELGFVAASDPRFAGTLAAVERDLRRGDFLLRYAAADDFGVPTSAFTVCTFWYADALAAVGRRDEARAIFERALARRNPAGLLSEDLDPVTGELWGNFPQTYSMVGLISSALRLSRSWEEGMARDP